MTKTTAPRVRALNLYTVELDGLPVAQALAISQADAVRLYVESVQQPVLSARLSSPIEARALAGLPLLQREPAAADTRVPDMFDDAPGDLVSPAMDAAWAAAEVVDAEWMAAPAVCDPVQVAGAGKSADLPAEFLSYIDGEEVAAAPQGELVGCPSAAPTAVEPAGASSAVDDDGGRELTAAEQATYEAQGAARFERHHGSELKRQAEAAAARRAMGGKPVAMYRDPVSGQSWSGRGLKPRWLLAAIEAGRTQDEFLIDPA